MSREQKMLAVVEAARVVLRERLGTDAAAWNRRAGDDEVKKLRAELAAAREALRQALNSRAVDYAEAEHIGWGYRAQAALGDTP